MGDPRRLFRFALVMIAAATGAGAQQRGTDYNFFDSRTLAPGQSLALRRAPLAAAPDLDPGVMLVRQPSGDAVQQMYRLDGNLTPASAGDAETVARAFLEEHRALLALTGTSVFSLPLERRYESAAAGLTHLVFRQQYAGIAVFGGDVVVHLTAAGSVLRIDSGAAWPQTGASPAPVLSAAEAAEAAVRLLEPALGGDSLRDPIRARLVWFPRSADAVLAWELFLHLDATRWFCVLVDASTGELLFSQNLYRDQGPRGSVFRAPDVPNPNVGPRSLESFTGWPVAAGDCPAAIYPSQYRSGPLRNQCWVSAMETSGNNVVACLDASGLNQCDAKAFSAQADFEFAFSNSYASSGDAAPDRNAAITNLFYWNNVLHDRLYALGFDEAAGNFQVDNFGRGGFAGDPVRADAQDGSGLNNSNFATPPDGSSPRMQIFLFTNNGTFLRRDADFDGQIISHEYVHGLTMRLVGGPGNVNALWLWQSGAMAEGWSDAYACSFTNNPVFGEYLSATPATGVRSVAYHNNPHSFGRFGTLYRRNVGPLGLILDLPQLHRDGEIWATVLWDLRAALGSAVFEQLVTTALKLTPARPSMLDARNAILQAAQAMGISQCVVWPVFAQRGFGASAGSNHTQAGQPNDTALSVYEAYDQPPSCGGSPPAAGATVFFDDMEGGASGWTATGLWHQTSRRAAGGIRSWWYGLEAGGNYATGARTTGTLTSLPIVLVPGTKATLEWDQFFKGEGFGRCYPLGAAGCDPYLNYDSGWVQVSRDGGSGWDTLTTLAHNSDGSSFDHHKVDISRYAGSTILIRFLFDSLDGVSNQAEGWFIDNVVVRRILTGSPILSVIPASLSFSATTGGPNPPVQTLAVSNLDSGFLNWTVLVSGGEWLTVSPASGRGDAALTVTARTGGMVPGAYSGTITVTAPGAGNSPSVVAVTFTVLEPVAEWRFEEAGAGGGVQIVDSTGNGRHGTTEGYGSAPFSGVAGRARASNGITDWIEMPASAAFSPPSFTFRAWVKLLAYPTEAGWGVVAANYGGNYQGWYLGVSSSGRIIFSVASLPGSTPWLVSSGTLALQRWYLITTTYDGATRQGAIYINGALDAGVVFPGFTPQSALPLTMDRASWFNGYYLNAAIDEARILPVGQGPAQVLADYQSFPSPPAAPSNTTIIADWRLDDTGATLTDSSGNARQGAFTGAATAPGILNGARSFNGAGDYARVAASDAYSPSSFTIRVWLKLLSYPQAAGWGVALSNYGGNYQGWYLGVHATGRVIFATASLPASAPWLLSTSSLALNRWYHLAATYEGAARRATIYIDGAADAQATLPGFTPAPAMDLYFGRASWYAGYYLNALMDEAQMLSLARGAAEIRSDYLSFPAQPPAVPVAEWKLDDAGSTLADSSGNGHNGTASGTSVVTGIRNSARSFNGTSDRVQVPSSGAFSPSSFTVRAWVKLPAFPSPFGVVVANYGGNYQGWYLGIHPSGRVIFSVASLPGNAPWLLSNSSLSLNTWSHITATYDGSTRAGTIYINGAPDVQAVFPGFTPQSATDLFLGRASWYNGYYLSGVLDEVRLLGSSQSPAEVLSDYHSFP